MSSVFSGKSLRFSAGMGVVFIALAFVVVSWSDTEQNTDASPETVIAMRASGAANPCNPCNPCAAVNPCNPCNCLTSG